MKAAVRDRYGPPEVVRIEEVDRPTPTGDEVLVRVVNASVNRGDLDGLLPRPSFTRLFLGLRTPRQHRLGIDLAGIVEAIGPDATRFRPGDRVLSDLFAFGFGFHQGAFAEYLSGSEKGFLPIPDGISYDDAATLPHSAVLALQGLRYRDGRTVGPGDKVLIDGASGNVGPFAVQLAKARGAEVTGVTRTEKLDFVRSLGADHVIDYTTTDYTRGRERYDWIVDTDSHHSIFAVRRALRPGGVYVTLGGESLSIFAALLLAPFVSRASGKRLALLLWWKPLNAEDVATVAGLITEGKVTPRIDRRFPLSRIVDALKWVNDGHARGKVVIDV